jgi:hypothetical protein
VRANGKLPSDGITFGSSFRSRLFLVHIERFLGDEPNRPVIRSHGSRVIVVGMGERTGAGSVSIADRPSQGVPVGVAGEQLQNTADGVRMVVGPSDELGLYLGGRRPEYIQVARQLIEILPSASIVVMLRI